jgi:antibiotic biosynthesis monooxygenase (ABM) superfamily enzyme
MTIFWVDSYVIKPDKLSEYMKVLEKFKARMKEEPGLFREVRTYKAFTHMLGGKRGGYVEMFEFENLTEFEKWRNKISRSEFAKIHLAESASLIVPGSESLEVWNAVV